MEHPLRLLPFKDTTNLKGSDKAPVWDNENWAFAPEKSLGYQLVLSQPCQACGGDGIETCDNPDHGLLDAMSFRGANESRCPCCGHDKQYKIRGSECPDCTDGHTHIIVQDKPCEACYIGIATGNHECLGGVSVERIISAMRVEKPKEDWQHFYGSLEIYIDKLTEYNQSTKYLTYCGEQLKNKE